MNFADSFISAAGSVGIVAMLTYFFLIVSAYAFGGNFLFAFF